MRNSIQHPCTRAAARNGYTITLKMLKVKISHTRCRIILRSCRCVRQACCVACSCVVLHCATSANYCIFILCAPRLRTLCSVHIAFIIRTIQRNDAHSLLVNFHLAFLLLFIHQCLFTSEKPSFGFSMHDCRWIFTWLGIGRPL